MEWCDGYQLGMNRVSLKTHTSEYAREMRTWMLKWGTLPSRDKKSAGVITRQVCVYVCMYVYVYVCVCVCVYHETYFGLLVVVFMVHLYEFIHT